MGHSRVHPGPERPISPAVRITGAGLAQTRPSLTCPVVCPTEILAFNAALDKFKSINTEVICVSTDSEFTHLAWSQTPRKEGGLGPDLNLTLVGKDVLF
jgi:hypothetical protein